MTMPLSVLPYRPSHWRPTCAVAVPSLRSPESSITSTFLSCVAVAGSSHSISTCRWLIFWGSHTDFGEEERQPLYRRVLRPGHGFDPSQASQGLGALLRSQQPSQVLPKPPPLR